MLQGVKFGTIKTYLNKNIEWTNDISSQNAETPAGTARAEGPQDVGQFGVATWMLRI
jgi:hypothetical protein